MNKHYKTVLKMLKPRVKALGFSRKALEGFAAQIADNLDLEEEASEEDAEAAITAQVDAAIPYLKLVQTEVNRQRQADKARQESDDDDDEGAGDTEDKPAKKKEKNAKEDPVLAAIAALQSEIASLKVEKRTTDYKSQVESILKKKGEKVMKRELRRLARMEFKDADAFDEYLDELKDDIEDLPDITESNGDPGSHSGKQANGKEASKDDIEGIAALIK